MTGPSLYLRVALLPIRVACNGIEEVIEPVALARLVVIVNAIPSSSFQHC